MFNLPAELLQLVADRQALLDSSDHSPAFTRALNKLDGQLDQWPWLDVMRCEKALKLEAERTATVTTAA